MRAAYGRGSRLPIGCVEFTVVFEVTDSALDARALAELDQELAARTLVGGEP